MLYHVNIKHGKKTTVLATETTLRAAWLYYRAIVRLNPKEEKRISIQY